jgi:hypothetical protein
VTHIHNVMGTVDLQKTLATSNCQSDPVPKPHHPIMCAGRLFYHDDGRFECEHAVVGPDDERTRHCIDHSVAFLLFEELMRREGGA